MDDEPMSAIIQATVTRLRQEGFEVDLAETMTQAIESYYQRFYDVFVLDIDMSHLPDKEEGDGIRVLKRFISLHNRARVIMFSGAGTVPHWFEAANAHCFAYIAKDESDSIGQLITCIGSAVSAAGRYRSMLRKMVCPRRILVYCKDELRKTAVSVISETLGNEWEISESASLTEAAEAMNHPEDYGMVLLMQEMFSTRFSQKANLKKIVSVSPLPHVITACQGKDEYRPSILYLANLHPLRMVNLSRPDWTIQLEDALKAGVSWYGKTEIFKADMKALEQIQVTLPEDVLRHWEEFSPDDLLVSDEVDENAASEKGGDR